MGQGGYLTLVNGTQYTWRQTSNQATYQVETSGTPETVAPGQTSQIYIEFHQAFWITRSDSVLSRFYNIDGTNNCSFQILVKDHPSSIRVTFNGFSTPGIPSGTEVDLGWVHDGSTRFILSGVEGCFSSNHGSIDWMKDNLNKLGSRHLYQICMPGTHDAGMSSRSLSTTIISALSPVTANIMDSALLCQSKNIYGQLADGSRYLDIRPVISCGSFWTGHYTKVEGLWLGGVGQKISSVVDDVNNFTAAHKELVIVNLSHAMNTDVGITSYRDLEQGEWDLLFKEFSRVQDRYIAKTANDAANLTSNTLNDFIGSGKAAVIIVVDANIKLGSFEHQGFFTTNEVSVQDEYSNTDDAVTMINGQLGKLDKLLSSFSPMLFLLSWTLTPQMTNFGWGAVANELVKRTPLGLFWNGPSSKASVKDMAYSANKSLFTDCLPHCHPANLPNILYVDFLEGSDYAALAMAINDLCFPPMQSKLTQPKL
ncbi:hypothetical protein DBV05_g7576 [Lasiodiplodia theobromae]|uniref:PLC-like phosphodiesterase n=1 Tax=Lasiodiplodia theobromae TaxID=45133 RepID=A0A5N5D7F9_9PEZI|nr:hypothetical protein DBV05_g7576 [Lasiodiplodia theobromae]